MISNLLSKSFLPLMWLAVSLFFCSSHTQSAPLITIKPTGHVQNMAGPDGNSLYIFNIDPNGTVFDTIGIEFRATSGTMLGENVANILELSPAGTNANTDILGLNTIAVGWSVLNSIDSPTEFQAAGGPLGQDIIEPVDIAQIVAPYDSYGTYTFNFSKVGTLVHAISGSWGGVSTDNPYPMIFNQFVDDPIGSKFWDQATRFDADGGQQSYKILAYDIFEDSKDFLFEIDSIEGPLEYDGTPLVGSLNIAPTIATGGNLSWNPVGSANGFYFVHVTATDQQGLTDTGILRVEIVPEPATGTFALAGLSLLFRRRH